MRDFLKKKFSPNKLTLPIAMVLLYIPMHLKSALFRKHLLYPSIDCMQNTIQRMSLHGSQYSKWCPLDSDLS